MLRSCPTLDYGFPDCKPLLTVARLPRSPGRLWLRTGRGRLIGCIQRVKTMTTDGVIRQYVVLNPRYPRIVLTLDVDLTVSAAQKLLEDLLGDYGGQFRAMAVPSQGWKFYRGTADGVPSAG